MKDVFLPLHAEPRQRRHPKQLRSRLMVETIIEAAGQVFMESDFEAASTNQIAERAGISIGSLYQYFPNKDALILAVQKQHHDEVLRVVRTAMEDTRELPLQDAIREIIGANLEMHLKQRRLHAAIEAWIPANSKLVDRAGFQEEMAGTVMTFLSQRPDVPQGAHLQTAVFVIMNMVKSVMHAAVQDCNTVPDRDQIVDRLTVGILGCLAEQSGERL